MKRVLVLFIVGVVLFGVCSAQNANAQSANIAQRIIGTWVDNCGSTLVYNANGNLTWGSGEFKFAVTDTQLAITNTEGIRMQIWNLSMSSDGRTLILSHMEDGDTVGFFMTKR